MSRIPLTTVAAATSALLVVTAIVVYGALVDVQIAVLMLAGLAAIAGVLRMVVKTGQTFTVRRRAIDVPILLGFAAVLTFLGLTTPLG